MTINWYRWLKVEPVLFWGNLLHVMHRVQYRFLSVERLRDLVVARREDVTMGESMDALTELRRRGVRP